MSYDLYEQPVVSHLVEVSDTNHPLKSTSVGNRTTEIILSTMNYP